MINALKMVPNFGVQMLPREETDKLNHTQLEIWANAQRDGRPAEYRWRPLFNAANFG